MTKFLLTLIWPNSRSRIFSASGIAPKLYWKYVFSLFILLGSFENSWGQNAANYSFSTSTAGSLVDMSSGTTDIFATGTYRDDDASDVTDIGFEVGFMGGRYTQFSVNSNGQLRLGSTAITGANTTSGPILAPLTGDNGILANGSIHFKIIGSAPNRTLAVEWQGLRIPHVFGGGGTGSVVQALISETSGVIEYRYGTMFNNASSSSSRSIGFSNGSTAGTIGVVSTITTTPTYTATATSYTTSSFPATSAMTNLNSTADGSRRTFTFTPTATPTAAPTNLTFSNVGVVSLTLNWTDNASNEVNYAIYRSTDNTNFSFIAQTNSNVTSYTDNNLTPGTQYYYWVRASSEALQSAYVAGNQATQPAFVFGAGPYTIDNTVATGGNNFTSFTDAINALNPGTVTGPLTFNVAAGQTFTEIPPAITKSGSAANPIIFQKNPAGSANPTIMAPATGTGTTDYIIGLFGADYITFDGINLSDANNAAATTNVQREWGYFIGANSTTNGAQNNTIRNCTITLNGGGSTTPNTSSVGIVIADNGFVASNNTTAPNSFNKINGNTITGPVTGIFLSGNSSTSVANQSSGNEIGTTTGNTITARASGTASTYGVRVEYQTNTKTENNTISMAGSSTGTMRGIGYGSSGGINGAVLINNNTITLLPTAAPSTAWGIHQAGTSTPASVTITNNKIQNSTLSATSGTISYIEDAFNATTGSSTITGNQVTNNSAASTGVVSGIYHSGSNGVVTLSNNTVSGLRGTGASQTLYLLRVTSGSYTVANNTVTDNAILNTTGTTTSTLWGYYSLNSATLETITGNTFTNLRIDGTNTGTGHTLGGIRSNPIAGTVKSYSQNIISNLSIGATGTPSGAVNGIFTTTGSTVDIFRNKIYDLLARGATSSVNGINIASGTTVTAHNNLIGDLRTPTATGLLAINGIQIAGGTTINVYYNTLSLNASSTGATFGTTAIYLNSTSAKLDSRNNIIVNTSTAAGTDGYTAAFRRASGTAGTAPANYEAGSNNNLFYAGAPSSTNLIYIEGSTTTTNAKQTLTDYKSFMGTKDQASVTENPPFLSNNGPDATFLHVNPTIPTKIEGSGLSISGFTIDYDNETRNASTPDIGADEGTFTPNQTTDVGISALTSPVNSQMCFTNTETITVLVRNQNSVDLDLSGIDVLTVNGTITSTAPSFTTITLPTQTITSGTITGNGTLQVTFPGTYDLSAAGTYTFSIAATVTGDADSGNDALPSVPAGTNTRTVQPLSAGTAATSANSLCGTSGTTTLTLSGNTGGSFIWQASTDNVNFTNIAGATSTPYTTSALPQTTYFRALASCNGASVPSNVVTVTVTNPAILSINSPVTRCGAGIVNLTASADPGATINWYDSNTSTIVLATGSTYSPSVTISRQFYVGASVSGSTESAGMAGPILSEGSANFSNTGLVFTASKPFTIQQVTVYNASPTASTITVNLVNNSNGAVITTATLPLNAGSPSALIPTTLNLNFAVPAAGTYRLVTPTSLTLYRGAVNNPNFPFTSPSGTVSITGGYWDGAATRYYNFYNWQVITTCEGARTAIQVDVTNAPALTPATTSQTLCAGSNTTITFSGYPTLTVSPAATAVVNGQDITFNPPNGTTTYTITGTDADNCQNTATVTLTATPLAAGTASSSPAGFCGVASGAPILTLSGTTGQTGYVWQQSATGLPSSFTNIPGSDNTSPFTAPTITQTNYYQAIATCGSSTVTTNVVTVTLANPQILATNTPVERCGPGEVVLTATASSGSTAQYYTTATGGTPFATGPSATVNVTDSTIFYVGSKDNNAVTYTAGLSSNAASNGTFAGNSSNDYPIGFNVSQAGTLVSVDVYPTAAGTSSIQLYTVASGNPGSGTAVSGALVTRTFTASEIGTRVTVPLGFVLTPGSYKLSNPTNGAVFGRYGTYTGMYPLTSGAISVVGSYFATSSTGYSNSTYNNFFNLAFTTGCEQSTRTPIQVNVIPGIPLTPATASQTLCAGTSTTITFSGYPTLTVSPAATAVVNGQDITFSPAAGTTTYTVTGTDGTCASTATVTLTVPPLVAGTASSSPANFCGSTTGSPVLTLSGNSGAQGGFIWQQSSTGLAGSFTDIPGSADQASFNAPAITATTYYQAVSTCGPNAASSNVLTVVVGSPTILTTNSSVSKCGAGAVVLEATASAGSTPYYYATATSVVPLGHGNSQTVNVTATPATQTFYVSARDDNSIFVAGLTSNAASNGTLTTSSGVSLGFAVSSPGTLQSVDIYPATGTSSVTIRLTNVGATAPAAGTTVTGSDIVVPISAAQQGTKVTVPLNYFLTPGNYKLTNTSGSVSRFTAFTGTYPITNGPISVTGSYASIGALSYTNTTYNSFFNLTFASGCESARTPININVTVPPALTFTGSTTICNRGNTTLTFSPSSYTILTTNPASGATVNGSAIMFNPTATTTYTITGNDGTGPNGCSITSTATITVNPTPDAPTLTPAIPGGICPGGSITVTAASNTTPVPLTNQTILPIATFDSGLDGFVISPTNTNPNTGFARVTAPYSLGTGSLAYQGPNNGGAYLVADADKTSSTFNSSLVSPVFSTINFSAATLTFQQYFRYISGNDIFVGVEYSTNGTTWTTMANYTSTRGTNGGVQTATTVSFPAGALNQSSVQIRFRYDTDNGYYWAIDNVGITGNTTMPEAPFYSVTPATGVTVNGSTLTFNPTATTTYQVTATFPSSPGCSSPATPFAVTVNTITTYTGAAVGDGNNWLNAANWSACVPTRHTDAVIPAGLTHYPILNTSDSASVRTLTIANGGNLTQNAGILKLYGDLTNNGTFNQASGVLELTGTGNQLLQGVPALANLTVNGAGNKSIGSNLTISGNLTMLSGLLTTEASKITLTGSALISETNTSYVLGQVETTRNLGTAAMTDFGGMGLELTPASGSVMPGITTVRRVTGTQMNAGGPGYSIPRYFDIQSAINTGLNIEMIFHYLDHEVAAYNEANLVLYRSGNQGGSWFADSASVADPTNNRVTLTGVSGFSFWTAGDITTPLPVELVAFNAVRKGNDALLTWTTASEKNSQGFEVEVSTNSRDFRALGFVESHNGSMMQHYTFTDSESGKEGLRYYRLKQLDLDGAVSYSPIKAVTFNTVATQFTVYPNPFSADLTIALESALATEIPVSITDLAGKTVWKKQLKVSKGANQLKLELVDKLPAGLYLLHLQIGNEQFTSKLIRQ